MLQSIPLDRGSPHDALIEGACEWLRTFYPDVHIVRGPTELELEAAGSDADALNRLWSCAAANAALLARADDGRTRVLAELLR